MKKVFALILAAAMTAMVLSGCGGQEAVQSSNGKTTLNVYNWGQYIADGSDDSLDIIAAFEEKYPHIDINYSTFDSN